MDFEEIKTQVIYLEDRVLTNFDKYFSELILMDFYEGGYEGRLGDELFYEEYFSRYEQTIIDLLLQIEEEFDEKYLDIKLRLIKLKRKIDTYLSTVKDDEIEFNSNTSKRKHNRKINFLLNPNLDSEKFITLLHNQLFRNKLINIELDDFKTHFSNDWTDKIRWFGTEVQILNLISLLIKKKYLHSEIEHSRHQLVVYHFTNKKGMDFKNTQLSSVKAEKMETIPSDDTINDIIEKISTHLL